MTDTRIFILSIPVGVYCPMPIIWMLINCHIRNVISTTRKICHFRNVSCGKALIIGKHDHMINVSLLYPYKVCKGLPFNALFEQFI